MSGFFMKNLKSARCVTIIVVGNEHDGSSSNPERNSISYSINTLDKGMNPNIFLQL